MTTPILKITEAANGQVDQYLTYNEALRAMESSTNNFYVVDMSSGDVTLTDAANVDPALNYIFSRNQVFRTSGNTVARVLTVPQSKRLFVVQNGGSVAVTVKRGTTEFSVASGRASTFYCDATANGLVLVSGERQVIAASAISNALQPIPNGTIQKCLMASQEFDYGSFYDPVTSIFTPTVPGLYQFLISAGFIVTGPAFPAAKRLIVYLYKNGEFFKAYTEASQEAANNICESFGLVEANGTTDYFEMYARHDTGSADISIAGTANTRMQMIRVGSIV